MAVDEGELANLSDAAANVAGLYARLREDVRPATRTVPDLECASRPTRVTEVLFASSYRGERLLIQIE